MVTRKTGIPDGFAMDFEQPKPVKVGDYVEEVLGISEQGGVATVESPRPTATPAKKKPRRARVKPKKVAPLPEPETVPVIGTDLSDQPVSTRARPNISKGAQERLAILVSRAAKIGPEKTVKASEVLEALILAGYDAREHLDLKNVGRRGKYGSATHKNFPVALAESLTKAIKKAK